MMTSILIGTLLSATPARIERVVVYADRAEVSRVTRVKCAAGAAVAVFENLPERLDRRTLRGSTRGGGQTIGTTASMVERAERADERAQQLQKDIDDLLERMNVTRAELAGLQEDDRRVQVYSGVLQSLVGEGMRNRRPPTRVWATSFDQLKERRVASGTSRAILQAKLQKMELTERRLRWQLGQLGAGGSKRTIEAAVTVDCGQQKSVEVLVEYVVSGARWRPEYDLDFTPAGKKKVGAGSARLTVSAIVEQSTGEDWTDVALLLSTAKPKLGVEPPMPAAQWIDGYEEETGKVLVQASERRETLATGSGPGGASTSVLEDRGQSFALQMKRKVTIVADGRPYWVPVDVITVKGTSKLVTIPKLRLFVYQLVSFDNPAPYPLLTGKIHSFRRGSFVGTSALRYRGPGEPMEISLGVDEEIRVDRSLLEHVNKDPRFLSSTKKMIRGFQIKVTNHAAATQTIEVRENIPVSKIEDVEVEIDPRSTKGYTLDAHRGFVTWQVPLREGEAANVDLAYTIALPDDWKVQ